MHKWLRWYNESDWIANHPEQLEAEKQRALANAKRAEQERQRAERLAQLLREQGIDPDKLC
ncbi:hypothetical protein BGP_6357 [Beggiatoa sp. PS]|nr:hypothetical protein BGP_6357 [Beggiatoa sp. PS]